MSPAFKNIDDAALYARALLPDEPRLFGGLLLIRADGLYLCTQPVEVADDDFDISAIYPAQSVRSGLFPGHCKVAGRYRSRVAREPSIVLSHLQKQTYLNMLSVDTLFTAFDRRRIPAPQATPAQDEYLFGPQGAIIRYRSGLLADLQAQIAANAKGEQELRNWYHPAARLITGFAAQAPRLTLDVVPSGKAGEFKVIYKGQPLPKAKVVLTVQSGWSKEAHADEQGLVQFDMPWKGTYVAEATHDERSGGERTGPNGAEKYDGVHYVTSVTYVKPDGVAAIPAGPAAKPNK